MTIIAWIALVATGLFAGAALYVSLVEHPARLDAGAEAALAQWRPSYKRATRMQATLAGLGAAAALLDGVFGAGGGASILAGLLLAAVVPFTLLVIYPANRKLEEPHRLASDPETLTLLQGWGRLHWVRVALGLAAFLLLAI
jgi:Anthrone oxygenase